MNARFFYTSPVPIDDPLSPLPPPANATNVPIRLPPKPFSQHDNTALEKAWLELRKKILKYQEQRGEKSAHKSEERARKSSQDSSEGKRPSVGKPATPRARFPRTSLSQVDTPPEVETDSDAFEIIGLLAEINYQEVTPDGSLRHPVFIRLRKDKSEVSF